MLDNLKQGLCEDGSPMEISESDRADSIRLWVGRETRVLHSIVNCGLALKDYELAMVIMEELCHRYVWKKIQNNTHLVCVYAGMVRHATCCIRLWVDCVCKWAMWQGPRPVSTRREHSEGTSWTWGSTSTVDSSPWLKIPSTRRTFSSNRPVF